MMEYKKKKATLYALLAQLVALNVVASGCGYSKENTTNVSIESFEDLEKETNVENQKLEIEDINLYDIETNETIENSEESPVEEFKPNYEIMEIPGITAIANVHIRDDSNDYAPIIGLLKEGNSIKKVNHLDNGWYEVEYYNRVAYVSDDYAKDSVIYDITGDIYKTCYTSKNIEISFTNELNGKGMNNLVSIPKYECVEIYEETDTEYLVKINGYIGYIKKQSIDKYLMDELKPNYEIMEVPSVTATSKVNIRKSAENGEVIGSLIEGASLKMLNKLENGWYEVEYYDDIGYISGDFVYESSYYDITGDILKICYATEEVELIIPAKLSSNGIDEKVTIPTLECFEIYEETDNNYLVKTIDYIGYVPKQNLEQLSGTLIVGDISSQEVILYVNNEIVLRTPVVTGNPNKGNATHEGLFEIYSIAENTVLRGEDYATPVKIMMKFHQGEGFHDAKWRTKAVMGGDTYLTNGSHGCFNMIPEYAINLLDYIEIGTPTLIKK